MSQRPVEMDFPMEIGHVEEIEEHIVETEGPQVLVQYPQVKRGPKPASASQKIVLIQTAEGLTRAVRVQTSPAVASSIGGSSSVQYVKSSPVVHRVGPSTSSGNVVVKSNVAQKTYVVAQKAATAPRGMTLAQAEQLGIVPKGTNSTPMNRVLTLNPTIKQEVGAAGPTKSVGTPQRVLKLAAVSTTPQSPAAGGKPRMVQLSAGTSGQGRVAVPGRVVPANQQPQVHYIEVVQSAKEEESNSPNVVYQSKQLAQAITRGGLTHKQEEVKVSNQTADRLLQLEGTVVIPGHNQAKIVMLPPDYMEQLETKEEMEMALTESELVDELIVQSRSPSPELLLDTGKKRPCNCTKSQCLKLYCECFANGEFCSNCNCKECFNNIEHEKERQQAIYNCLERNPNAFRPKIAKMGASASSLRHNKGCHCKRSGCLKNYCECFEARIMCSQNCRCVGCKNCDEEVISEYARGPGVSAIKRAVASADLETRGKVNEDDEPPPKQPYNFMTAEVVDATVQCMMAQADECQQNGVITRNTERLILEEFGRCLAEIIDFSNKNTDEEEADE